MWQARAFAWRGGPLAVVAVVVFGGALMVHAALLWPLRESSAALQNDIARVEALRNSAAAVGPSEPASPAEQLAQFYRFFPAPIRASDDLARLHEVAISQELQIDQASYRMVRDRGGKLSLYEISLPVRGEYTQLRKFISQAAMELPHLALDGITFQRQQAGDALLESQIKFTLFFAEVS